MAFIPQGLDHQLGGGAAKKIIDHLSQQVFLRPFFVHGRLVYVGTHGIIPFHNPFLVHDLHQLQGGGIAHVLGSGQ